MTCCSVNEAGLYDYVICNDSLEQAGKELQEVATRALQGLTGRPAGAPPMSSPAPKAVVSLQLPYHKLCLAARHVTMGRARVCVLCEHVSW